MTDDAPCRAEQSLGELGEFRNGANFSQDDYGPGYPIVNVKQLYRGRYASMDDLHELSAAAVSNAESLFLRYGDILFARSSVKASGAGQAAMVGPCRRDAVFSGFIIRFRVTATDRVAPEFLNYLLRSPIYRELLTRIGSGTTITNLSQDTLAGLPIELPPLAEQKAIAAVLGALDDKIELNRRMNATLEAMARALFQSWFVDFDPVRAKLDGRHPPGLDTATTALFPERFEDSALGPIPNGWSLDTIKNKASNIQYGFTQSASNEPIGPHFLRITDIRGGVIDWASVPFCEATEEERQKYRVQDGDIFIARTGASTGDNIYVVEPPSAVFASYLIRVQFASRGLGRVVAEFTRTADYADHVAGTVGGSAQPNASAQALAAASLVYPTEEVADEFYRAVRPLDLQRAANDRESRILATVRDTLLPKVLSGEVTVSGKDSL